MKKEKYVQLKAPESTNKPEWVLQRKELIEVRIYYDNANQASKIFCTHDDIDEPTLKKIMGVN